MSKFNQQCFSQVRLVAAHKEWQKTQEQAVQVEVDRALTTAREAWVTKYQAEVEDHVKSEVENARDEMNARNEMNARDEMNAKYEADKQKAVQEAVEETRRKFESERKQLKEELDRKIVSLEKYAYSVVLLSSHVLFWHRVKTQWCDCQKATFFRES